VSRRPAAAGILVLLLAAAAAPSCRRLDEAETANGRARAIWDRHERAVVRAIAGQIRDDEFLVACRFFHELTGIEVRGDGTTFGWIATKETPADLEALRRWYRQNGDRLYADDKGRVTVRGVSVAR
jgi:hypothetical protein